MFLSGSLPVGRAVFYIAVAATAWGTGGAVAAVLYAAGGLGPQTVSFWRFLGGALVLGLVWPLLRGRDGSSPLRRFRAAPVRLAVTGAGMALYQTAYFAAVGSAGVAVATVVTLGSGPILVALGARLWMGERLGRRGALVIAAALAGLLLLVLGGDPATGPGTGPATTGPGTSPATAGSGMGLASADPDIGPGAGPAAASDAGPVTGPGIGPAVGSVAGVGGDPAAGPGNGSVTGSGAGPDADLIIGMDAAPGTGPAVGDPLPGVGLALLSAVGYAGTTLLSRRMGREADGGDPIGNALIGFAVGALCLLPLALAAGVLPAYGDPVTVAALLAYLGLVPSALAYGLFFAGLRTVTATTASVVALVEPVAAAAIAVLFLGERLTVWALTGGAVLLAAVVALAVTERDAGTAA